MKFISLTTVPYILPFVKTEPGNTWYKFTCWKLHICNGQRKTHDEGSWRWLRVNLIKPWVLIKGWTCKTLSFGWGVSRIKHRVMIRVSIVTLYVVILVFLHVYIILYCVRVFVQCSLMLKGEICVIYFFTRNVGQCPAWWPPCRI